MDKKYSSSYFEEYARLTLLDIAPEWATNLVRSDRPDLQNDADSIGIEVTSSTPGIQREISAYGNRMLGKEITQKEIDCFHGEFFCEQGKVCAFSPTKGLCTIQYVKEISDSICAKISKAKNYKQFGINGLYIFTGTSLIDDVDLEELAALDVMRYYDFVYLNCIDIIYRFQNKSYEKFEISNERLVFYKKEALKITEQ